MPRRTHRDRPRLKAMWAEARRARATAYDDPVETPREAAIRLVRAGRCSVLILDDPGEARAALGPWTDPS